MKERTRAAMMVGVVLVIAGVGLAAAWLQPPSLRTWLTVFAILAGVTAVQAVTSAPRDLVPALLFALVPVAGLVAAGRWYWIGPVLAAILLLAAELGAVAWEGPARMSDDGSLPGRLGEAAILATAGLGVASLLGVVARPGLLDGAWAVAVGAGGIAGLAAVTFRGGPPSLAKVRRHEGALDRGRGQP